MHEPPRRRVGLSVHLGPFWPFRTRFSPHRVTFAFFGGLGKSLRSKRFPLTTNPWHSILSLLHKSDKEPPRTPQNRPFPWSVQTLLLHYGQLLAKL
jgi:hypothetical protein